MKGGAEDETGYVGEVLGRCQGHFSGEQQDERLAFVLRLAGASELFPEGIVWWLHLPVIVVV